MSRRGGNKEAGLVSLGELILAANSNHYLPVSHLLCMRQKEHVVNFAYPFGS